MTPFHSSLYDPSSFHGGGLQETSTKSQDQLTPQNDKQPNDCVFILGKGFQCNKVIALNIASWPGRKVN